MASQSTSSTGVTRITGTYSGLDVDSLVKAGLTNDQNKLDKAKQSEQIMEWRQEQYRTIMTDATKFTNKYLSSTGEKSLMLSSDWNAMKATSDKAAVTATASAGASAKNYTVNVDTLATAASCQIGKDSLTSATTIKINNTAYTLHGTTAQDRAKDLNSQLSHAGVKVNAKYSDFANGSGGLILESQTLGSTSTLTQASLDAGADQTINAGTNLKATISDGSNTYTIDNTNNSDKNKSNSVTLDNVTFNFKNVTTTSGAATISTTKDVSTVADKITSFVDDYNTLMKEINGKIYETYNKSYAPLTDAQRTAMSDSEITKWETKAKTGLLRKDEYLTNLADEMKDSMTSMMKDSGFDLRKLGIEPVQDYGVGNGTYIVKDKSKLTSALENNLDKVYELFNKKKDISANTKSDSTDGILSKLTVSIWNNANTLNSNSKLAKKAGVDGFSTGLTNEMTLAMRDQKTLIDTMEDKLKDKETSLYNKYSALETKLSSLDSSSSYLTSMLGQ